MFWAKGAHWLASPSCGKNLDAAAAARLAPDDEELKTIKTKELTYTHTHTPTNAAAARCVRSQRNEQQPQPEGSADAERDEHSARVQRFSNFQTMDSTCNSHFPVPIIILLIQLIHSVNIQSYHVPPLIHT